MSDGYPSLKNDLLLRAARGEETERAPVWCMRQAGRSLPEFMKLREGRTFFELCQTPALASEATLQPVRRYAGLLDAAIIFSDILVIPQAMGMVVEMKPGPYFPSPLNTPEDIVQLKQTVDVDKELGYVYEAITITRKELNGEVPLIGFVGAPWTLMAYMVEGETSKTYQKSKTWLFRYPKESKKLLLRIADVCADHLIGQIKAGAQIVQVFDSWASHLSPHDFVTFALPSLTRVSSRVRAKLSEIGLAQVPMILFEKGANTTIFEQARDTGFDVIGLDWTIEGGVARSIVDKASPFHRLALQGNLDPAVLFGGKNAIEQGVKRMCESFKGGLGKRPRGWIANLGHGVTPDVQIESMQWFLECVHKYSAQYSEDP